MTWQGTCGSTATIGMAAATIVHLRGIIHVDRLLARTVWVAAAVGTPTPTTAELPIAASPVPAAATTALGFRACLPPGQ